MDRVDGDDGTPEEPAADRPVDRFRQTAVGAVVTAGLLGLRDALEGRPEREEIPIVQDAPTPDGAFEPGFTLSFDEDSGRVTVVLDDPIPDEDPRRLL